MAIRGSLREVSLPDVLQLLSMGRKTGCLAVTHRQNFGSIYFARGRISFATIVNRRDRLGDLLVTNGSIARVDLDRAIASQSEHPERRLGEILIAHGLITREELHQHIKRQIEEAVYHLFSWTQGTFSFEPGHEPDEQDFVVSINPESLLLEGARRVDEWSLIEKKVPGFDSVFALDRAHLAETPVDLTLEQEALLPLLDGMRDVQTIIDASGLGEFEVGKALYGLATAGFIHRVGRKRSAETPSADSRVSEHRNLGVAFYKSAMFDEAAREFRRALELRPEDDTSEFHLGLVALRDGRPADAALIFRGLVTRLPGRAAVHANLALALEQLGDRGQAWTAATEAARLAPEHPAITLQRATLALHRGDVRLADELLTNTVTGTAPRAASAAWYHLASLAAALAGDLERAVDIATRGMAAHPQAASLANNLGVMLSRMGREAEATLVLERALVDGPGIPQLHRNVGDLHLAADREDEALESYTRAVRLNPDLGPRTWEQMGTLRSRRGERDDAARCWQRARTLERQHVAVTPGGVAAC